MSVISKDLTRKLLGRLITFYRKAPVQPFRKFFLKVYLNNIEPSMLDKNRTVIVNRGGVKYKLNLSQYLDMSVYYQKFFEPRTLSIYKKLVKPGMTVFDVGANIGYHTLQFRQLVGKEGQVFAFEPASKIFPRLRENISLNNFNNIFPVNYALSNVAPKTKMLYSFDGLADSKEKEEVEMTTLDDYVERNNIKKINFIKIDTDGCEYKIVSGGYNSIKNFKPVMIIEFSQSSLKRFGDHLEDLIDLLASHGYSFSSERHLNQSLDKKAILEAIPFGTNVNILCRPI